MDKILMYCILVVITNPTMQDWGEMDGFATTLK